MQDNPNIVKPVEKQMICLALECGKFIELNISMEMPSMKIDVRLANINVASVGFRPKPLMNVLESSSRVRKR